MTIEDRAPESIPQPEPVIYKVETKAEDVGSGTSQQPVERGTPARASFLFNRAAWMARAACKGPHAVVFFPPSHIERKEERLQRERAAKNICKTCSVSEQCLGYALRIREAHGIWGGLNESERRQFLD